MAEYSRELLDAIYELGRLYFDMGYFPPAERIFAGLSCVDSGTTPSQLGMGLIKLERGLYDDAIGHFRAMVDTGHYQLQSKLGICAALVGKKDLQKARIILDQMERDIVNASRMHPEQKRLWEALKIRCSA